MSIFVSHPHIGDTGFDYAQPTTLEGVKNMEDMADYFKSEVQAKFRALEAAAELRADASAQGVAEHVVDLGQMTNLPPVSAQGIFGIKFPWHISFYQHINYKGDDFQLGVLHQTHPIVLLNPAVLHSIDWDRNLTKRGGPNNGRWNDCISSVRSHSYNKYWALFEHVDFGGDVLFGVGDQPNLHTIGWGDKVSSIIMSSMSIDALRIAIRIITGVNL